MGHLEAPVSFPELDSAGLESSTPVSTETVFGRKRRKQDGKRTKNPIPSAYFYFDGMELSIWLDHPNIM